MRSSPGTTSYHDDLRQTVCEYVEEEYANFDIKASGISFQDALKADEWAAKWSNPNKVATWDWKRMYLDCRSYAGDCY